MMRWFGLMPFARLCEDLPRVEIPVGMPCTWCHEPITINDHGVYFANSPTTEPTHHECFVRLTVGSVAHQEHRCSCFGGSDEDDPTLSKRRAAQAAVLAFERAQAVGGRR